MSGIPLHLLPPDAVKDFEKMQTKSLGNGVDRIYSGHDQFGLAFRFFIFDEYNALTSKLANMEMFDRTEMKETFVDKKTRLHEKVTNAMRVKHPEEYRRFKEGLDAPGTPLRQWGVIPSNECRTLEAAGIFTVEQLSLKNADYVQSAFPAAYFEYFTRAQQHVARMSGVAQVEQNTELLVQLQKELALMKHEHSLLRDENQKLAAIVVTGKEPAKSKKTWSRKKGARAKESTDVKLVGADGQELPTENKEN